MKPADLSLEQAVFIYNVWELSIDEPTPRRLTIAPKFSSQNTLSAEQVGLIGSDDEQGCTATNFATKHRDQGPFFLDFDKESMATDT